MLRGVGELRGGRYDLSFHRCCQDTPWRMLVSLSCGISGAVLPLIYIVAPMKDDGLCCDVSSYSCVSIQSRGEQEKDTL